MTTTRKAVLTKRPDGEPVDREIEPGVLEPVIEDDGVSAWWYVLGIALLALAL